MNGAMIDDVTMRHTIIIECDDLNILRISQNVASVKRGFGTM
jgi:hypothetical protein